MTHRLPNPGSDNDTWGYLLNDFLSASLNSDGSINPTALSAAGVVMANTVGQANGVASLGANALVPRAQLGTGTPSGSNYLRGDGTWAAAPTGALSSDADVSITSPTLGQVLTYDSTSSKWKNSAPAVASVAGRTGAITIVESDVTNLTTDLAATEKTAKKGVASGYAGLDASVLVPKAQLGTGTASATTYLRGDGTWSATRLANDADVAITSPLNGQVLTYNTSSAAWKNVSIQTSPTLVTSLPASPTDGQEIYLQADVTKGVNWHLRYRSASASTYKWEYLGGPPMMADALPSVALNTISSFTDFSDASPTFVLPVGGDYMVSFGANMMHTGYSQGITVVPVGVGAAATFDNSLFLGQPTVTNPQSSVSGARTVRLVNLSPGTIKLQYYVGLAGGNAAYRWLSVIPVRVA